MEKLLTLDEVAELLRRSPRTVCKLPIPIVRLAGSARLYDPRDVRAYVEATKEYLHAGAKVRSTKRSWRVKGISLDEALAKYPAGSRTRAHGRLR